MSIPYQNIAKFVALRAKLLQGGDAATRDAIYSQTDISTVMDGVEVPYLALRQTTIETEAEIAAMIGNSNNTLYRAALMAESGDLDSGDEVPTIATNGKPFIGSFDGLFASVSDAVMTEQPSQIVDRRILNPGGFWKRPLYGFYLEGTLLTHSESGGAYYRGCSWDQDAQFEEFDTLGESPLPFELSLLWGCMILMHLPQEDWFIQEARYYAELVEGKEQAIVDGKVRIGTIASMPNPTSRPDPNKD